MGGGRGGLPDTKRGGGQSTSGPIYEKCVGGGWGEGGQFASGPLQKWGGGGGGGGGGFPEPPLAMGLAFPTMT